MNATRNTGFGALALGVALSGAGEARALTLEECGRVTHISYAGEAGHRDFGGGVVGWANWWSQEGVEDVILLVDCGEGRVLRTVTRSENIAPGVPFDRTDRALAVIEPMLASPVMRGFEQIADRLSDLRIDPRLEPLTTEPCACAAAYPELRGDRPAFEMETL